MTDLAGRTLGKYQLTERLGRGGMADVYKAFQPGMNRFVAIKTMHGHLAESSDFVERFRREAQSVGQLRHAHIVQMIDFDTEGDVNYMVMEFIRGDTLKAYILERGALPVDEALRFLEQLADALEYAHGHGMIHRDIKPANIMFTDEMHRNLVLTDFGIARILDASGLTVSGASVGTPAYMSPEAGKGEHVDERADLYSLGVVFYEMLTGQVPFNADTPYAIIMKHIHDPLPLPQKLASVLLPEAVERLLFKLLMKNTAERFQTAGEVRAAIKAAQVEIAATEKTAVNAPNTPRPAGRPAASDQPTTAVNAPAAHTQLTDKAAKPGQGVGAQGSAARLPLLLLSGALVVAVLVIAVLLAQSGGSTGAQVGVVATTPASSGLATADPVDAGTEPAAATAVSQTAEAAVTMPETTPDRSTEGEVTAEAGAVVPESTPAGETPTEVAAAPTLASVSVEELVESAQTSAGTGDYAAAVEAWTQAIAAEPDNAGLYVGRGYAFYGLGRYAAAVVDFNRALTLDPQLADAYLGRGSALVAQGQTARGLADMDRALELEPDNAAFVSTRAWTFVGLQDWDRAIADYTRLIELYPSGADGYGMRGYCYVQVGDFEAAVDDFTAAIGFDPQNVSYYMQRGDVFLRVGDYEPAERDFTRVIDTNPADVEALRRRGEARVYQGNYEGALQDYSAALEIAPDNPEVLFLRGDAYLAVGDQTSAIADFTQAIELAPGWGLLYARRSQANAETGNYEAAIADATAAIALEPDNAAFYSQRGWVYFGVGDMQSALDDFSRAMELDHRNPEYPGARAAAYSYLGDYQRAVNDYSRAIILAPMSEVFSYYIGRGWAYYYLGDQDNHAIADFSRAIQFGPDDYRVRDAYVGRAYVYGRQGEGELAVAELTEAIRVDPGNPYAYAERGWMSLAYGDYASARDDFSTAIAMYPEEPDFYNGRGDAYMGLELYENALADYDRALAMAPENPLWWVARGWAYLSLGDHEAALADFNQALELDENFTDAYFARGEAFYVLERFDEALDSYRIYLQLGGDPALVEDRIAELEGR